MTVDRFCSLITLFAVLSASMNGCATKTQNRNAKPTPVAKPTEKRWHVEPVQSTYPAPEDGEEDEEDDPAVDPEAARRLSGNWVWLGTLTPTETFRTEKPNNYRLSVKPNGWFEIQAECVKGEGLFEAKGNRIAFAVVEQTGDGCESARDNSFFSTLESAGTFRFVGDKLRLKMKHEKREMVFHRPQ